MAEGCKHCRLTSARKGRVPTHPGMGEDGEEDGEDNGEDVEKIVGKMMEKMMGEMMEKRWRCFFGQGCEHCLLTSARKGRVSKRSPSGSSGVSAK